MSAIDQGRAAVVRAVHDGRMRRRVYAVAALLLALLCLWPQPHVARAKILPQDNGGSGVSAMLNALGGQMSGFANLLGGARTPIDVYLVVGRSENVMVDVIDRLRLVGPSGRYATVDKARIALARKVDVHSLPGGVIEVETRTHDAAEAKALTFAYVSAISDRIATLGRERIVAKRKVVDERFGQAVRRLSRAEAALNEFRRRNRLAEPEAQFGSALMLRADLEARLQAKLVQLQTVQRFAGAENVQLKALQSEIAALRAQIARSAQPAEGAGGPNVAGLAEVSAEYLNLYRDYRFAQALYEAYSRLSEQVAVDELTAESAADVQLLERPHLDAGRHYNIPAVALLAALLLLALFTEVYAPATGIALFRGTPAGGDVTP
ncbi:capsule biosynthesis protein [Edaphosphingomonas haloaromaticamans]|uniref:Capsule biosynthesis protein n=1 Tax=Edaphosphingomonas haloaromaticamans TaxID=653954 RepID=A0A1S1H7Z3_9SPHN|nr:capsule biosynthesis protein [Sphingomonas haloaromaticamans]OHT18207.1 hypothetical protein BHE75_00176 [Sphingomonas haloaromaticamans]